MNSRKLLRIICIDTSLSKGGEFEIMVGGNTALNGINGAGKTSLLLLLPVFYGRSPGNTVREKSGTTLSFVDWYLPRPTSYLIYEYQVGPNPEDLRCVFMRRGEGRAMYRFVRDGFLDEMIYEPGLDRPFQRPSQIEAALASMGIEHTAEVGTDEYRLIIQRGKGPNSIRRIQEQYALPVKNASIHGVDDIVYNMIENGASLSSLKVLIASLIEKEIASGEQVLNLPLLEQVQKEHKAYTYFDTVKNQVEIMSRQRDDIQQVQERRNELLAKVARTHLDLCQKDEEVLKKADIADQDIARLQTQKAEQLSTLISTKTQANGELQAAASQIEAVSTQRKAYDKEGLEAKSAQNDRKQNLEQEANSIVDYLDKAQSSRKEIEARFKSRLEQIQVESNVATSAHTRTTEALVRELEKDREKLAGEHARDLSTLQAAQDERLAVADGRVDEARSIQDQAKEKLTRLQAVPFLPDDAQRIEKKRTQVADLQQSKLDAERNQTKADLALRDAEKAAEELDRALKNHAHQTEQLQQERVQLQARLEPPKGSLLEYLRQDDPTQVNPIYLVASEDLLLRTDLSPERVDDSELLYGVSLDLSSLPLPAIANQDDIVSALKEKDDEIAASSQRGLQLEQQRKEVFERYQSSKTHRDTCQAAFAQQTRRLEAAQDELTNLVNEAKSNHLGALEHAKQVFQDACAALKRELDASKALIEESKKENAALSERIKQAQDARTAAHNKSWEQAVAIHDERQQSLEAEKQAIHKEIDTLAAQGGLDPERIHAQQVRLRELQAQLKQISDFAQRVHEYQNWKKYQLPMLAQAQARADSLREDLTRIHMQEKQIGEQFDQRLQQQVDLRASLREQHKSLTAQIDLAQRILGEADVIDIAPTDEDVSGFDLARAGQVLAQGREEAKRARHKGDQALSRVGQVLPYLTGSSMEQQIRTAFDTVDGEDRWIAFTNEIAPQIDQMYLNQRTAIEQSLSNIARSLGNRHSYLSHIDSEIRKTEKELNQRINSLIQGFGSIKGLSISLVNHFDKDGSYKSTLKRLERAILVWRDDPRMEALDTVMSALAQLGYASAGGHGQVNLESYFDLQGDLTDRGGLKKLSARDSIKGSSSTGLSAIVGYVLYVAFLEMYAKNSQTKVLMPLDEALKFSFDNFTELVRFLNDRNLYAVMAYPEGAPERMALFENTYVMMVNEDQSMEIVGYKSIPFDMDDLDELDDPGDVAMHEKADQPAVHNDVEMTLEGDGDA